MTTSTDGARYEFMTAGDGGLRQAPRLFILGGAERESGHHPLPSGGVQVAIVPSDRARVLVNVPWVSWLAGLRYLAVAGVVPIADLALPGIELGELDPGKLADDFSRGSAEHLRTSNPTLAPAGHEFWNVLRRSMATGFYVGFFASRRVK